MCHDVALRSGDVDSTIIHHLAEKPLIMLRFDFASLQIGFDFLKYNLVETYFLNKLGLCLGWKGQ